MTLKVLSVSPLFDPSSFLNQSTGSTPAFDPTPSCRQYYEDSALLFCGGTGGTAQGTLWPVQHVLVLVPIPFLAHKATSHLPTGRYRRRISFR
jgi:hypothetical protein